MNSHFPHYIEKIARLHHNILHNEFSYLKDKAFLYHRNAQTQLQLVTQKQLEDFQKLQPHIDSFETYRTTLTHQITQTPLDQFQDARSYDLFYKEGFIMHYLKEHQEKFTSVVKKQQHLLQHPLKSPFEQKIVDLVHKKTHSTLQDYLHQEEELYSNYLALTIQNTKTIEEFSKELHHHEVYNKCKNYILDASLAITAIPLGPLELASLPLWGAYFSLKELEKLDHNFQRWRSIEKPRIIT